MAVGARVGEGGRVGDFLVGVSDGVSVGVCVGGGVGAGVTAAPPHAGATTVTHIKLSYPNPRGLAIHASAVRCVPELNCMTTVSPGSRGVPLHPVTTPPLRPSLVTSEPSLYCANAVG